MKSVGEQSNRILTIFYFLLMFHVLPLPSAIVVSFSLHFTFILCRVMIKLCDRQLSKSLKRLPITTKKRKIFHFLANSKNWYCQFWINLTPFWQPQNGQTCINKSRISRKYSYLHKTILHCSQQIAMNYFFKRKFFLFRTRWPQIFFVWL